MLAPCGLVAAAISILQPQNQLVSMASQLLKPRLQIAAKDHATGHPSASGFGSLAIRSNFATRHVQARHGEFASIHKVCPHHQRCAVKAAATDPDRQASSWSVLPTRFNPAYAAILAAYAGLFLLKNPYIFAVLSIATIIPQNSTTTSLNTLVILFYDSGLFMNFAEAVYCVRLITWLSIFCTLASFAVFA